MTESDPFLWLEDIEGAKALAWVREQNARTLALLERDPRYLRMLTEARAIITAPDRIPYPSFLGERLVNFWQDDRHVRGLWRKAAPESFNAPQASWETALGIATAAAPQQLTWVI